MLKLRYPCRIERKVIDSVQYDLLRKTKNRFNKAYT